MAKLPTTRESRMASDTLDQSDASDRMAQAQAQARRWLATHPRPLLIPGDPFPADLLLVQWQTPNAQGVIHDPWTQLEDAIAEIGEGRNTNSAIWMITYITARVK